MKCKMKKQLSAKFSCNVADAIVNIGPRGTYDADFKDGSYMLKIGKHLELYMSPDTFDEYCVKEKDMSVKEPLSKSYLGFDIENVMDIMRPVYDRMLSRDENCQPDALCERFKKKEIYGLYMLAYGAPYNDYKLNSARSLAQKVFDYIRNEHRTEDLMGSLRRE